MKVTINEFVNVDNVDKLKLIGTWEELEELHKNLAKFVADYGRTRNHTTFPVGEAMITFNVPEKSSFSQESEYVGLRWTELCQTVGSEKRFRIVSIDGKPRAVTADYHPDRLNIYIDNDIVTKVTYG